MPWCQGSGAVRRARWPELRTTSADSAVGQGDAEEGGAGSVAAEDEVGRGDGSAGQRGVDFLLQRSQR